MTNKYIKTASKKSVRTEWDTRELIKVTYSCLKVMDKVSVPVEYGKAGSQKTEIVVQDRYLCTDDSGDIYLVDPGKVLGISDEPIYGYEEFYDRRGDKVDKPKSLSDEKITGGYH